jgi:hypothetical protein
MTKGQQLYFLPKTVVLWIFIALKNPSPLVGFELQTLGPMASKITITPSRMTLDCPSAPVHELSP